MQGTSLSPLFGSFSYPMIPSRFVFIFSWATQLLATALKLFIHVRMQMTHNKQTNLKEIYEDEQFKVLILYFFRNQSVGRGNLQRTRTCLGS